MMNKEANMKRKFQPMDLVKTVHGTVCVVEAVTNRGELSVQFPKKVSKKEYNEFGQLITAWRDPAEFTYVGNVWEIAKSL
jgi:hypothetical protein